MSGKEALSIGMEKSVLKKYVSTEFEKLIVDTDVPQSMKMLPLIHKVDGIRCRDTAFCAQDYFESGHILPIQCDIFGEKLIYTYIGRPAYVEVLYPVCFVLEPCEELLEELFVFDTGAYVSDLFGSLIDMKTDVNEFRINADIESVKKFITYFFGDNESYYISTSKTAKPDYYCDSDVIFAYEVLAGLRNFSKIQFDTRCRTMENIIRHEIDLKKYLKAIIISSDQARTQEFKHFLEQLGRPIDVLKYPLYAVTPETGSNRVIRKILYQYFIEKGYV